MQDFKAIKKIKSKRISVILLFIFTILLSTIQAQQTIPTTGADATGTGGSVSYTIGQVVYMTNSGINGSVAEGVQQAYEISVVIGIEQAKDINLYCTVFPNPSNDLLTLKVENYDIKNLLYQLFDLSGKLLETKKITSNQTSITISNLPSGTYLLKIIQTNNSLSNDLSANHNSKAYIKTFKIIKNN